MINNLYLTLIILCFLAASICTFITDFNNGKILNKHLLLFFKIGLSIQIIYSIYLIIYERQVLILGYYILNVIVGTGISLALYHFDIWGAGDSKYVILMLCLYPINVIANNKIIAFQGLMVFIITFSITFLYLIIESLYLFIKESPILIKENQFELFNIKEFFVKWIFSFSVITIIYKTINIISGEFLVNNIILVRIGTILFMFYFVDKMKNKKIYIAVMLLGIFSIVLDYFINCKTTKFMIDYKMILFILVIIICRNLCSKYNYKKIKTIDAKEGMILSAGTFIGFINSKVKGLPMFKSESIHSKISIEEAESIKRWEKSKYGQEYIYIVRQIPFAPFISIGSLGSILYFLL